MTLSVPNCKYGPNAQTPEQRARVLRQMLASGIARHRGPIPERVRRLYEQYVAGELTWAEVCARRDAPLPETAMSGR